jgi:hypothetical protein
MNVSRLKQFEVEEIFFAVELALCIQQIFGHLGSAVHGVLETTVQEVNPCIL